MTIQEAYSEWAQQPVNHQLAVSTARAWRNVWATEDTGRQCETVSIRTLVNAVGRRRSGIRDRVNAASVMVHVLHYAHQQHPDTCPEPTFTFGDIVQSDGTQRPARPYTIPSRQPDKTADKTTDDGQQEKRKRRREPVYRSPKTCHKVLCRRRDGSSTLFDSVRQVAEHYGVSCENVRKRISIKRPFRGMMLAYDGDPMPEFPAESTRRHTANGYTTGTMKPKPIRLTPIDGSHHKVLHFASRDDAAKHLGVCAKHLANHVYNGKPLRGYLATIDTAKE